MSLALLFQRHRLLNRCRQGRSTRSLFSAFFDRIYLVGMQPTSPSRQHQCLAGDVVRTNNGTTFYCACRTTREVKLRRLRVDLGEVKAYLSSVVLLLVTG